ncbi:MAG: hypothetical protein JKY50_13420 [Oleispira sp.]|nr:hypothetical protein [Oleispira sp.]MBL4880409.1 hypothetical protein [Oleispira sp.]
MKHFTTVSLLAMAISAQAAPTVFNAQSPQYLDLSSGNVSSIPTGVAVKFHRDQIQPLGQSAYTGSDNYASVTSSSGLNFQHTKGAAGGEWIKFNSRNNDELVTWNENWWGANSNATSGINLDDSFNFFGQNSRHGQDIVQVNDSNGDPKKGLLFPRRDSSADKRDMVALPFNQLIVRTSEGDRYVRLRAISIGDPQSPTGERLANWASNNLYFKYAVAAADGAFGAEKEMCVSFSTDAKKPYHGWTESNKVNKDDPFPTSTNANPTFGYSFSTGDVWYKQQFIDFDQIIDGPGNNAISVDENGNVDISAYTAALAQGYAEGCIPAFYDGRPAEYFPSQYVDGFTFTGADTPVSSRRADWLDDDNNSQTPYNGNEKWDIAIGLMVAPGNFSDWTNATYELSSATLINSGRIGESGASTRSTSGYAAAVMIPGSNINVDASQNIGDATGTYTLVADIDDVRSELGGKTVRESLMANGKSVTEQYNSIDSDNNGTIISNQRVYVVESDGVEYKFQVQSFDASTGQYTVNVDQL